MARRLILTAALLLTCALVLASAQPKTAKAGKAAKQGDSKPESGNTPFGHFMHDGVAWTVYRDKNQVRSKEGSRSSDLRLLHATGNNWQQAAGCKLLQLDISDIGNKLEVSMHVDFFVIFFVPSLGLLQRPFYYNTNTGKTTWSDPRLVSAKHIICAARWSACYRALAADLGST
jgi:hypothetical protein